MLKGLQMPTDSYPLHPGQTHAEPLYATVPLEEYERIITENRRMKETLKRLGKLEELEGI